MRIVFIGPFASYPKGTVPLRMLPLAKKMRSYGHNVVMILPPYDNIAHSGKNFRVDGIDIFNVVMHRAVPPVEQLIVSLEMVRQTLRLKPDVVHVFKPKGYSGLTGMFLILMKFLRVVKFPVVLDSDDLEGHGGFADFYITHGVYPRFLADFLDFQEKWLLKHSDAVTVASRALEEQALKLHKRSSNRVFYVPNGPVPFPKDVGKNEKEIRRNLSLLDKRVILLYTRFFECDIERVIDILNQVVSAFKDVKLLIVGKGDFEEEKKLLKIALRKGLLEYVAYAGWIKPEEILSYIRIADVAIYPFEDTPLNRAKCPGKLVQLMISGKAIVADRVGQIAEYIEDGKSGILVKPGDTKEFARRVVELLGNKHLCEMFGKEARKRILSAFDWEFSAAKVQKIYYAIHSSKRLL